MSKAMVGAKAVKGPRIKPIDCKKKGACPCNAFLRCSGRRPYGNEVWGNKERAAQAMQGIAYGGHEEVDRDAALALLQKIREKEKKKPRNPFYRNLKGLIDKEKGRVLVMPAITEIDIDAEMNRLKSGIHNAADFTYFQISMAIRANLVRNEGDLQSDIYVSGYRGKNKTQAEKMIPYSGSYTPGQWSLDHVQVQAKGGCNRFCNGALLRLRDNCGVKNDRGPGCPCVDVRKKGAAKDEGQNDFKFKETTQIKRYSLYECTTFCINKRNKAENMPTDTPGSIKTYKEVCCADDPRKPRKKAVLKREVEKICK